jgi:hypothetical protein
VGSARLAGIVLWNEVQSQGWADPSPVLFNRYAGRQYNATELGMIVGLLANMTREASVSLSRWLPDAVIWLSTDHFVTAPPLHSGDVMHVGLYDMLPAYWAGVGTDVNWGLAVHPYDNGDPRSNLTSQVRDAGGVVDG